LAHRGPRGKGKITPIFRKAIPAERNLQLLDHKSEVTSDHWKLESDPFMAQFELRDLGNS
jgi:hypothetical protein